MQKRKNRWYIAVAAVVILAVVLVLAVVLGKKGKIKKDPKMIEPTQQEQASEIPTETEEVFDYSATETAETKSLPKSVVSKQGILIDVDAGTILAGKDALKRMIPASMTKIFTVLVAAENIKPEQLDELVTISIDATDFSYSNDCSNTGYEVDEQVTVRDLFYGTILPSGADSAVSLATYVAGSQEAFVDMMNQELEKMGLSETTSKSKPHPDGITISNWFLRRIEDKDTHSEIIGAKTGFVNQSGSCAASMAQTPDGKEYICVTAGSTSSWRCIYDHVDIYDAFLPETAQPFESEEVTQ